MPISHLAHETANEVEIVQEYYDAAVSGADPINERPGFSDMLSYLHGNGARIILVESASRFARDLAVQITGHELLQRRGIELVPVDAPDHFTNETPTATMVRQILGAVSQFEKAYLVEKLRKARERKRMETGRCEGRKPVPEIVIKEAKRLYRKSPRTGKRRSLRMIAKELATLGHVAVSGTPYGAESIKRMVTGKGRENCGLITFQNQTVRRGTPKIAKAVPPHNIQGTFPKKTLSAINRV